MNSEKIKNQILTLVKSYYNEKWKKIPFKPGITPIPVSGKVFDSAEIESLVEASLDFWLTTGRFAETFEKTFSNFLGSGESSLCNSGSSANLLALASLTSPKLGNKALKPGDEVVTTACGFPTTLNPIIQLGLKPVLVDIKLPTYNINCERLKDAISKKTKALIFAHTLGNPFDLDLVLDLVADHNLWLIEDNCDALGSLYKGQMTGTFGHLSTFSFYPAHHITMGEGGCVVSNYPGLKRLVESYRDWGRDCWCKPGHDDTCHHRFETQMGTLPYGYDHKYIYTHIGYNLKMTDMQPAIGLAQLKKFEEFKQLRKKNWNMLWQGLKGLQDYLILPESTLHSDPNWFGFPISIREDADITRNQLVGHLEKHKIGTRLLFGGNLTRHPAYENVNYHISGNLKCSDFVTNQTFWIGVYPGLSQEMIQYVIEQFNQFSYSLA